jgi:Flp pilus assembly protein TadG
VEFALVFPIFFVLLLAVIEFAFAFHALLSINFASRNGALIAAEAGNAIGADCIILKKVQDDLSPPAEDVKVLLTEIYWSDQNGNIIGGAVNNYDKSGSTSCLFPDGTTITVPFKATSTGYPEIARCNVVAGCGGGHNGVDTIGVRITYDYTWKTPLSNFIGLIGAPFTSSGYTFVQSNAMRMEPVL